MPRRFSRLKWHRALPLVSLAVALGLLLVMLIGVDRIVAEDLTRRARFRIGQAAETYAEELNRDLSQRALALDLLARSGALESRSAGAAAWRQALQRFRERDPNFVWLGLVDLDGVVLAGSDGLLEGVSIAHRPVFNQGRKGPWFGSFHPPVTLKPLLESVGEAVPAEVADMAVPVRDTEGRVWAVLTSHFDARAFALLREDVLGPADGRRAMDLAIVNQGRDVVMGRAPLAASHWPVARLAHDVPAIPVDVDGGVASWWPTWRWG